MSIDLSRQAAMIPERNVKNINALIIGCGSIGSNAAHVLASMGVERMTLVDGDAVQPENIGPAYLSLTCVDVPKVEALGDILSNDVNEGIVFTLFREHFSDNSEFLPEDLPYNLIIIGTDNLESRRLAWRMRHQFTDGNKGAIWVDGRMGGPQLSMYAVWTLDEESCKDYEQILFHGAPPPPLPCGMKATAALTKGAVPMFVGQIVYNMVNDIAIPYMQMKDLDGTHVLLPTDSDVEFRFEFIALPLPDAV